MPKKTTKINRQHPKEYALEMERASLERACKAYAKEMKLNQEESHAKKDKG